MKKKLVIGTLAIILAVVLTIGGMCIAVLRKEAQQRKVYGTYVTLMQKLERAVLLLTEDGEPLKMYHLDELGMLDAAKEKVEQCFTDVEKMSPADFSQLLGRDKLAMKFEKKEYSIVLDGSTLDADLVVKDLMGKPITAGRARRDLTYALRAAVDGWTITPDLAEQYKFDLKDIDRYLGKETAAPEYALEDLSNPAALVETVAESKPQIGDPTGVIIPVHLMYEDVFLSAEEYLLPDEDGALQVDTEKLRQQVALWEQQDLEELLPYMLSSQDRGLVPMEFIGCSYELDGETLAAQLTQQLETLDSTVLDAPYLTMHQGAPFVMPDTYVEIDLARQELFYYEDGQMLLRTDIVSGNPNGHWSWPGLYWVQTLETDRLLWGEDYTTHVDYWIGYENDYGIHDAPWREEFGGELYKEDGSHGCINTPSEAMKELYSYMEPNTLVVVHYYPVELDA